MLEAGKHSGQANPRRYSPGISSGFFQTGNSSWASPTSQVYRYKRQWRILRAVLLCWSLSTKLEVWKSILFKVKMFDIILDCSFFAISKFLPNVFFGICRWKVSNFCSVWLHSILLWVNSLKALLGWHGKTNPTLRCTSFDAKSKEETELNALVT